MDLNEYQAGTDSTAIYRKKVGSRIGRINYAALGLTGEAGEVANLVKKIVRDDNYEVEVKRDLIKDELGDVLWYISALATELGLSLQGIAEHNQEKLTARHRKPEPQAYQERDPA